jgi:uncharacterized membrane protein
MIQFCPMRHKGKSAKGILGKIFFFLMKEAGLRSFFLFAASEDGVRL